MGQAPVRVADIGTPKDAQQIQTNVVRVDGQRSVYVPVLKQGGDTNTIAVVDGIKERCKHLFDVPKQLVTQGGVRPIRYSSRRRSRPCCTKARIGLLLTSLMILIFLGSMRATVAVFFSIPLSALAAFIALSMGGGSINSMVLGGLALAFSRLIDNSVVVLENIYRHLETGRIAGGGGGKGRAGSGAAGAGGDADHGRGVLPGDVPVRRQQVSVFGAGAGRGALAVRLLRGGDDGGAAVLRALHQGAGASRHALVGSAGDGGSRPQRSVPLTDRFNIWFNNRFEAFLESTTGMVGGVLRWPGLTLAALARCSSSASRCFRCSGFRSFRARMPGSS